MSRANLGPSTPSTGRCIVPSSGELGIHLELTHIGDQIKVRFEVHRSPVGHTWPITIHHNVGINGPNYQRVFRGIRVASDGGDFVVQLRAGDRAGLPDAFRARATDTQTGQLCKMYARIG